MGSITVHLSILLYCVGRFGASLSLKSITSSGKDKQQGAGLQHSNLCRKSSFLAGRPGRGQGINGRPSDQMCAHNSPVFTVSRPATRTYHDLYPLSRCI